MQHTSTNNLLGNYPAHYDQYFSMIEDKVNGAYDIASRARTQAYDPTTVVEAEVAFDLADRVQHIMRIQVGSRLRQLLSEIRPERAALILADEIANGQFGYFDRETSIDMGIRVGLAVVTEGVTVAPIQGISKIKIKANDDGTESVAVYFAGPIRSAGGTEAAFTLVIADHLRRSMGLERYRPDDQGRQVSRFVEELRIYEREVGSFQYRVSDRDLQHALVHMPVEIDGVETDPVEVIVHRGINRIETDRVRGGALRVMNDGIIGRSRKLLKLVQDLSIPGWEWLADLQGATPISSDETSKAGSHFDEVISGRPVLSTSDRVGGFRLRYGRCYNTGISAVGVHPATCILLDHAVVTGTQVKINIPGKGATIGLVDTLEPPIVRLKDGSVIKVTTTKEAKEIRGSVEKLLHLGDILISYGDFLENNVPLQPSPYVEEWWSQEVSNAIKLRSIQDCSTQLGLDTARMTEFMENPLTTHPEPSEAFLISEKLQVPLHPKYLYYWNLVSPSDIIRLRIEMKILAQEPNSAVITLPNTVENKTTLERTGIIHRVANQSLLIEGQTAYSLIRCLDLGLSRELVAGWKDTCELISMLSRVKIRSKGSVYIAARVGRPEKAMERKMKPPVHVLFPVGNSGGSTRDILKASQEDKILVEILNTICEQCSKPSLSSRCRLCGSNAKIVKTCRSCGRPLEEQICPRCKAEARSFTEVSIPLKELLAKSVHVAKHNPRPPFKGVRGLTNATKVAEALEKGILRSKHELTMYKDGTIRFDVTNAPMTHFTPEQTGTPVDALKRLGYEKDHQGKELVSEKQLLELMTQDIIIPIEAADYLLRTAQFVDDLLQNLYGLEPYYNAKTREDIVGCLVVGLAPHTSVGVVGRIVGYTKAQVLFAHPYWHSAKRRDCDGDGDSIILLLDVLLNFSREFLPAQIGGLMDAPLLIQPIVIPHEVQRQAHNMDTMSSYPVEFYEATLRNESSSSVSNMIEIIRSRLGTERQFTNILFTHRTSQIASETIRSCYSTITSLPEKLDKQIELAKRIMAVEPNEVVASVLRTHLLPDIIGNMKAYTSQTFRCKTCNHIFRRIPIRGNCLLCGGELQQTVTRGSVEKYLHIAQKLSSKYDIGEYLKSRVELVSEELKALFTKREKTAQTELTDFLQLD